MKLFFNRQAIQTALDGLGWNFTTLSQVTGISQPYLSIIVNAKRPASDAMVEMIASALEVPPESITMAVRAADARRISKMERLEMLVSELSARVEDLEARTGFVVDF